MSNRASGILLPISSLPSKYGIGCFSKSAYDFVDWLQEAGQTFWQILPVGPTSYGDSPYQSFSTFAGNPYFIDLEMLAEDGLVEKEELDRIMDNDPDFFFRMLPYAIAMGVDTRFAKLFGDQRIPQCSFFVTKDDRSRTAAEWALLLRKTADRMDARQRKMQLEKWLLVARRR